MQIIAEVKTHSPFGWKSDKSWLDLFEVANKFGDIISIHTDTRWQGSLELIRRARKLTNKPILAKGIHAKDSEITDALNAGADLVLVVGRIPEIHLSKCLVEPNTLKELSRLPKNIKAVWNSRDLETGGYKSETFIDARKVFDGWLCQASNIKFKEDIVHSADAILVGTNLISLIDSLNNK